MWNPVYFNYGIAVHGAGNVPSYPASHGCVRIPMHIGNYFPSLVKYGDQVFVFDGVKEPEAYGAQLPPFNTPDPSYTTTTSTHDDDHHAPTDHEGRRRSRRHPPRHRPRAEPAPPPPPRPPRWRRRGGAAGTPTSSPPGP